MEVQHNTTLQRRALPGVTNCILARWKRSENLASSLRVIS